MKIEYDSQKSEKNKAERGFLFDSVQDFDWDTALVWQDKRKDYGETRYASLGVIEGRVYALCFKLLDKMDGIRVISLRKANKREQKQYEEERANY